MKILSLIIVMIFSTAQASDRTVDYETLYQESSTFTPGERQKLTETEIVLIPGIVSEAFSWQDTRGIFDFSFLFQNYLEAQQKNFKQLGLQVSVLLGSSYDVEETLLQIRDKLGELKSRKKKALFITHSMGGLVLTDYLLKNQSDHELVSGILFLQAPFHGSPVASVYFKNPYRARSILGPIMWWVNTSEESVEYLTLEKRKTFMETHAGQINELTTRIPVLTAGGASFGYPSLMTPSIHIISHGCITVVKNKCRSARLHAGPYDDSDGMVPLKNSRLPGVDYVTLKGVDHGETVLSMPFKSVNRVRMTDVLLKLLLGKMR